MNQQEYLALKKKHEGTYFKFNQQVLRWHLNKIFRYEYLLESAHLFDSFEKFFAYHTKDREGKISEVVGNMYQEAVKKGIFISKQGCEECLYVRMGNVYTGVYTEHQILKVLNNLSEDFTCEKANKETDTKFKVDAVITFSIIGQLAIQIKPISYLNYEKGEELEFHREYEEKNGVKVMYLYYKDPETILFNDEEMKLTEVEKIMEQIQNNI